MIISITEAEQENGGISLEAAAVEPYLTIEQVAEVLMVSAETVRRQFSHLEGVIDLGTPETRNKRRRRVLRIPQSTLNAFLRSKQVKMRRAA